MLRTRQIKPGFFTNEVLAQCSPLARICFAGLWCMADRDGKLEDRPLRIKAQVLPYDDCDINALLQELCDNQFVLRYEAAGAKYLLVARFKEHQHIHNNEASSKFPDPPGNYRELHEMVPSYTSYSLINTPPLPPGGGNPSNDEQSHQKKRPGRRDASTFPPALEASFSRFWEAYPKKVGKKPARAAWLRIAPDDALLASMLAALDRHRRSRDWTKDEGAFIPHPATWLNASRWEDELEVNTQASLNGHSPEDRARRARKIVETDRQRDERLAREREEEAAAKHQEAPGDDLWADDKPF
jgi:hypothetical protein